MADEELLDSFMERERNTLVISLKYKAARTSLTLQEFIDSQLSQGASADSIKKLLIKDLEQGGRIFGEFRSSIKSSARGSINRVRDNASYAEYGIDRKYRWVAILVNTCPDCIANHGRVLHWDEWEVSEFGLPRSGGTVCRENCRCVLVIEEATELEPLKRRGSKLVV